MNLSAKQKEALIQSANVLAETVQEIESRPETTQNHYGDYMALLAKLIERKKTPMFWALCLVVAGANKQGVQDAIRSMGHTLY